MALLLTLFIYLFMTDIHVEGLQLAKLCSVILANQGCLPCKLPLPNPLREVLDMVELN